MKFLVVVFLCLPAFCIGQIVDGINLIDTKSFDYIDIYMQPKGLSTKKLQVAIEYGQEVGAYESAPRVMDESGKPMSFNSMTDALNKFSKWGWELVSVYSGVPNGTNHAVLKRKQTN